MLQAQPTKKGTGLTLLGDYYDLQNLYVAIHRLTEPRLHLEDDPLCGVLHSFAYEVRKACDKQRIILKEEETEGVYLGFHYLWPDALLVTNVVRHLAGYCSLSDREQGCFYFLEDAVKSALAAYDAEGASQLVHLVGKGIWIHQPLLGQLSQFFNLRYVQERPSKARFRQLASLFPRYFLDYHSECSQFKDEIIEQAAANNCPPEALALQGFPETIVW